MTAFVLMTEAEEESEKTRESRVEVLLCFGSEEDYKCLSQSVERASQSSI